MIERDCRPSANARPTGAILFNHIVSKQVSEDKAYWTNRDSQGSGGPIPPVWWFSASVGGQSLAIQNRAISLRGRPAQCGDIVMWGTAASTVRPGAARRWLVAWRTPLSALLMAGSVRRR